MVLMLVTRRFRENSIEELLLIGRMSCLAFCRLQISRPLHVLSAFRVPRARCTSIV